MDEILISELTKLKDIIDNDYRIILLNKLDNQLKEDLNVNMLSNKMNIALDKYNDMVKYFKEDSIEAKNAQKELYIAKKNLDEHPLVKEYLKAYQDVRLLYEHINGTLFNIFKEHNCEIK